MIVLGLLMECVSVISSCLFLPLPVQVKYRESYEKNKGKVISIKSVSDDSQMAHSAQATKLQSDLQYKKNYEDSKANYRRVARCFERHDENPPKNNQRESSFIKLILCRILLIPFHGIEL